MIWTNIRFLSSNIGSEVWLPIQKSKYIKKTEKYIWSNNIYKESKPIISNCLQKLYLSSDPIEKISWLAMKKWFWNIRFPFSTTYASKEYQLMILIKTCGHRPNGGQENRSGRFYAKCTKYNFVCTRYNSLSITCNYTIKFYESNTQCEKRCTRCSLNLTHSYKKYRPLSVIKSLVLIFSLFLQ